MICEICGEITAFGNCPNCDDLVYDDDPWEGEP